mgnify:CR=1 FL=1
MDISPYYLFILGVGVGYHASEYNWPSPVTCQVLSNKRSALLIEYQVCRRKEKKTNVKQQWGLYTPSGAKPYPRLSQKEGTTVCANEFLRTGRNDQRYNPERESTSFASANRDKPYVIR